MTRDTLKILGINNQHNTLNRHKLDYYATPPEAVQWLLKYEHFNNNIWEPCCGEGNISETLKKHGYSVKSSDIHNYGYNDTIIHNFLKNNKPFNGDIITNPPYNQVTPMVLKALELTQNKVAMLLKIQFLESIKRHKQIFIKYPPSKIYIFTKRIACYKNGNNYSNGSAICFCWVIWEKQSKNITEPIIRWIPNYKPLN